MPDRREPDVDATSTQLIADTHNRVTTLSTRFDRLDRVVEDLTRITSRHDEEIFGDERRKTRGLVSEMQDTRELIVGLRANARLITWVIAILGGIQVAVQLWQAGQGS